MGPRTKTANSFTFNQPTPRPFTERAPTPHARMGRAGATKQVSSSSHTLLCAGPSVEVAITLELAARSALPGAAPLCKHMSLELNLICQFPCSSQAALASGPSQGASPTVAPATVATWNSQTMLDCQTCQSATCTEAPRCAYTYTLAWATAKTLATTVPGSMMPTSCNKAFCSASSAVPKSLREEPSRAFSSLLKGEPFFLQAWTSGVTSASTHCSSL